MAGVLPADMWTRVFRPAQAFKSFLYAFIIAKMKLKINFVFVELIAYRAYRLHFSLKEVSDGKSIKDVILNMIFIDAKECAK